MINDNMRTLGVLLAGFVALVVLGQSAHQLQVTAAVNHPATVEQIAAPAPVAVEVAIKKPSNELVAIPKEKCASTWIKGATNDYVLVTPQTCNDVSISSMTVAVSDKTCEASKDADFQNVSQNTHFKGEFGFYLGQGRNVQCVAVKEIVGKYL